MGIWTPCLYHGSSSNLGAGEGSGNGLIFFLFAVCSKLIAFRFIGFDTGAFDATLMGAAARLLDCGLVIFTAPWLVGPNGWGSQSLSPHVR